MEEKTCQSVLIFVLNAMEKTIQEVPVVLPVQIVMLPTRIHHLGPLPEIVNLMLLISGINIGHWIAVKAVMVLTTRVVKAGFLVMTATQNLVALRHVMSVTVLVQHLSQ
jgi:hypothetical protein